MKNSIIAAVILLSGSSVAFAADCPDFSGTFQVTNNPTELTLTVTQKSCESVTFAYNYSDSGETLGKTYPMDNVRRQTYKDKDLIVYETAGIKDGSLVNLVEDFHTATAQTTTALSSFTVDPTTGHLINEVDRYDVNGQLTSTETNDFTRVAK